MLKHHFVIVFTIASFLFSTYALGQVETKQDTEQSLTTLQQIQSEDVVISLTSLNKHINKWFILSIHGKDSINLHVHNRYPETPVSLTNNGLSFFKEDQEFTAHECRLWNKKSLKKLKRQLKSFAETYLPLCEGRIYVRMKRPANTQLSLTESATNLLRKTEFGENFINTFKPYIVSMMSESPSYGEKIANVAPSHQGKLLDAPLKAKMQVNDDMKYDDEHFIGIKLESNPKAIEYGNWYETKMHAGIFVGLFKPALIHPDVLKVDEQKANAITAEEKEMRIYMTAYDLDMYAPEYTIGTQEPKITKPELKGKVVPIGSIPPYELSQSVGVFIGGFKTRHNTINHGPNKGKTYGFIEKGVELAKMSPGLATAYLKNDGSFHVDKWPENTAMERELSREVIAARQNGVMLIDDYKIGDYVNNWGYGNWSGSAERSLKTMRSGICIQEKDNKRFLLFMAFTAATPSTMAQTMQAFSCKTAMHLDMNAYMYMHSAIYSYEPNKGYEVEYLNQHMKYPKNIKRHRYIMDNNSRDFFYLKRRQTSNTHYLGTR